MIEKNLQAVLLLPTGDSMTSKKQMILRVIGAKIVYCRTMLDIKQEDLAEHLGMSKRTLCKIESGNCHRVVSISELVDIADYLRIDVSFLLNFDLFEKQICMRGAL